MKQKTFLIILTKAPAGTEAGTLALDSALAAAAFDQPTTLLFRGDGVWHLGKTQNTSSLGSKATHPMFGLMEMYGVEKAWVCERSATERTLRQSELACAPEMVSEQQISEAIASADSVWVF